MKFQTEHDFCPKVDKRRGEGWSRGPYSLEFELRSRENGKTACEMDIEAAFSTLVIGRGAMAFRMSHSVKVGRVIDGRVAAPVANLKWRRGYWKFIGITLELARENGTGVARRAK